jgi:SAM-dependent methyltransferase
LSISEIVDLESVTVQPLSDARFLETHVAFETSSNQQRQILETLARDQGVGSVLSVGCGSGILDGPLAHRLAAQSSVRWVGLDPNPLHCRLFRDRVRGAGIDAEVVESTFEAFETAERFDRVLMIHAHYYFEDVPVGLAKAASLLSANGLLVLAVAPRGPLNRLAQLFWPKPSHQDLWFSEALGSHLDRAGSAAKPTRIEARLDVTECLENTSRGIAIRDFVVQADTEAMPERIRARIDRALRLMGRLERDGRFTVPHPVDLFELGPTDAPILERAASLRGG